MTQTLPEDGLLNLCLSGDERGWAAFVERYAHLIRWAIKTRILRSRISIDESEVDDIFQQVFTNIWRNNRLRALKSAGSISSWLVIIAQNATVDFIRDKESLLKLQTVQLSEDIASSSINPRTEPDNTQLYNTVEELVSELPLKERRIMTLELFYDLRHREIAKIMGLPQNTVSTIIARIKQSLKEKLIKRGYNV